MHFITMKTVALVVTICLFLSPLQTIYSQCSLNHFDPVCANGTLYVNPCFAEAAGFGPGEYFFGICVGNSEYAFDIFDVTPTEVPVEDCGCIDPGVILTHPSTQISPDGIVTLECGDGPIVYESQEVCGCDGKTYPSPCEAEASGVSEYTLGPCESTCYGDPIDQSCTALYDPVCGCDNYTYANACEAERAGIKEWTPGACGTGLWCQSQPLSLSCGDVFYDGETRLSDNNLISNYPGPKGSSSSFLAPEAIFEIRKDRAGDIQIGLEIQTDGLDLDIFLIDASCDEITVYESSRTPNDRSPNEYISAHLPIGTYFLVVDGQRASAVGKFRVELACTELCCTDAVELQCGIPYQGHNENGRDGVLGYVPSPAVGRIDNAIANVDNNGLEVVHTFTMTNGGPVQISLTGMQESLGLYLLSDCDRTKTLDWKFNEEGASPDLFMNETLVAGTYYLVVDGYYDARSPYTLTVDYGCQSNTCELALEAETDTGTCNDSSISLRASGGNSKFVFTIRGETSFRETKVSTTESVTFGGLSTGRYRCEVVDADGCSVKNVVVDLGNDSPDALQVALDDVELCPGESIELQPAVSGGTPPYQYRWNTGDNSRTISPQPSESTSYALTVTDECGASITQSVTVQVIECQVPCRVLEVPVAENPQYFCEPGDSPTLEVTVGEGETAVWYGSEGGSDSLHTGKVFAPDGPGTYYVETSLTGNLGCRSEERIPITLVQTSRPTISVNKQPDCLGDFYTVGMTILNATEVNTTKGMIVRNQNVYNLINVPLDSDVMVVASLGGCHEELTISAPNCDCSPPLPPVVENNPGVFCPDQPPILRAAVAAGNTVNWYDSPTAGNLLAENSASYQPDFPGTYYAETLSSAGSCRSNIRTAFRVTDQDVPFITSLAKNCDDNGNTYSITLQSQTGTILQSNIRHHKVRRQRNLHRREYRYQRNSRDHPKPNEWRALRASIPAYSSGLRLYRPRYSHPQPTRIHLLPRGVTSCRFRHHA